MSWLDLIFWVFAAAVCLFIVGVWISMLIPRLGRRPAGRAVSSGGGFADTGAGSALLSIDSSSSDNASESGGGADGGSSGDFNGGGGESGGGGSSGSW